MGVGVAVGAGVGVGVGLGVTAGGVGLGFGVRVGFAAQVGIAIEAINRLTTTAAARSLGSLLRFMTPPSPWAGDGSADASNWPSVNLLGSLNRQWDEL